MIFISNLIKKNNNKEILIILKVNIFYSTNESNIKDQKM